MSNSVVLQGATADQVEFQFGTVHAIGDIDIKAANIPDLDAAIASARQNAVQVALNRDWSQDPRVIKLAEELGFEFDASRAHTSLGLLALIPGVGIALAAGAIFLGDAATQQAGLDQINAEAKRLQDAEVASIWAQSSELTQQIDAFGANLDTNRPEETVLAERVQTLTSELNLNAVDADFINITLAKRQRELSNLLAREENEWKQTNANWKKVGYQDKFSASGVTEFSSVANDYKNQLGGYNQVLDRGRTAFLADIDNAIDRVRESDRIRDIVIARNAAGKSIGDLDLSKIITKADVIDKSRFTNQLAPSDEFWDAATKAIDPYGKDPINFNLMPANTSTFNPDDSLAVRLERGQGADFKKGVSGDPYDTPISKDRYNESVDIKYGNDLKKSDASIVSFLTSPLGLSIAGVSAIALIIVVARA